MIAHGAREASGLNRILQLKSLITLRMTTSAIGYFFLSVSDFFERNTVLTMYYQFFYTLLNLAFKLDVSRK